MEFPAVRIKSNGAYRQAVWYVNGQRFTRGIGAKSRYSDRQARAICRDIANELRRGKKPGAATGMHLSEWIRCYNEQRTDLRDSTRAIFDQTGRSLLAFFDEDPPIDRMTRAEAAEWRLSLYCPDTPRDNRGFDWIKLDPLLGTMSDGALAKRIGCSRILVLKRRQAKGIPAYVAPKAGAKEPARPPAPAPKASRRRQEATVCRLVRAAKRMFAEAEDQELVGSNPFRKLKGRAPKPVRNWKEVTIDRDLPAILDACPNQGWRNLFALCRLAGLRRGEALRLRWSDVHFDRNWIIVNADITHETSKQRRRTVPIELAKVPTGLTRILTEAFVGAGDGAVNVCAGVRVDNINVAARAVIARAGVAPYAKPFHTLRKCCETDWAQHYPQHAVSDWIGHGIEVSGENYLRVPVELYAAPPVKKGTNCAGRAKKPSKRR